ncbi:MAG: tetratricopeptide repeat protein [Mesorhizobium sp.]|uniref:tetratricopeptide repeat protein n=1 Tax=Mesorhizobium sp. TaxID=1871066 RepID=UPI000FE7963B|nr:tetratricopeptide repeat protein [Mesorhizobium sp.]RWA83577.1 MAG: tetratricopeptide repeat protein [Mesorhizobium sp.]
MIQAEPTHRDAYSGAAESVGKSVEPDLVSSFFQDFNAAATNGDVETASHLAAMALAARPGHPASQMMWGFACTLAGRHREGLPYLLKASAAMPRNRVCHMLAGKAAFFAGDMAAATKAFKFAIALDPFAPDAHNDLGQALKRQGNLRQAVACFKQSFDLGRSSRWYSKTSAANIVDPLRSGGASITSVARLEHDAEQLEYLWWIGCIDESLAGKAAIYRHIARRRAVAHGFSDPFEMTSEEITATSGVYGRAVNIPSLPHSKDAVVGGGLNGSDVEAVFATGRSFAIVDNFLSPEALETLVRFCREATVWFDCKRRGGYLGAYLHDGFAPETAVRLAEELPRLLPDLLKGHGLSQLWAFKYPSEGTGTAVHADQAAINVNVWLTPESSAEPGRAGGLRIYDVKAPEGWDFGDYNGDRAAWCTAKAAASEYVDIPYRGNRAVIFDSSLLHESLPFRFRDGYVHRRINLTLLFDRVQLPTPTVSVFEGHK